MEEALHLSSSGRIEKKKRKKPNLRVRGSVGSPQLAGYSPIELNICGGVFLLLQGLLVRGERGSKNINKPLITPIHISLSFSSQ